MSRTLLAIGILVILVGLLSSVAAEVYDQEGAEISKDLTTVAISSRHGPYQFFDDQSTNNLTGWFNNFQPYQDLAIRISGSGDFSLEDRESDRWWNGSSPGSTVIDIRLNGSPIWPIVHWIQAGGNQSNVTIFNFGRLLPVTEVIEVITIKELPMILITQYLKQEWRTLIWVIVVFLAALPAVYSWQSRFKRGRVKIR